jgi:hypothetical protein
MHPLTTSEPTEGARGFGVLWQSEAATPLLEHRNVFQSGVALRFPPQSKALW